MVVFANAIKMKVDEYMKKCENCDMRDKFCYSKLENDYGAFDEEIINYIIDKKEMLDRNIIESGIKETCYLDYAIYLFSKICKNENVHIYTNLKDVYISTLVYYLRKAYGEVDGEHFKTTILDKIIESNETVTEKICEVKTRIGQSVLRQKCIKLYNNRCLICNIPERNLLVTSHIKPWYISNGKERLDVHNTLLLCTLHDKMFDLGYISFDYESKLMISNELKCYNYNFKDGEKYLLKEESYDYLEWHRDNIFLG